MLRNIFRHSDWLKIWVANQNTLKKIKALNLRFKNFIGPVVIGGDSCSKGIAKISPKSNVKQIWVPT